MAFGWIKLSRQIQESWLWDEKPFSKGSAWIDLLMLANYEDKKMAYKGKVIICKRGDVNLSITALAERWGWDRKTVRKFLNILKSDGMVSYKSSTHRTTITIENYGKYQDYVPTDSPTKSQQTPQQSPITNNNKQINKNIYKPSKNQFNVYSNKQDYDFEAIERMVDNK